MALECYENIQLAPILIMLKHHPIIHQNYVSHAEMNASHPFLMPIFLCRTHKPNFPISWGIF